VGAAGQSYAVLIMSQESPIPVQSLETLSYHTQAGDNGAEYLLRWACVMALTLGVVHCAYFVLVFAIPWITNFPQRLVDKPWEFIPLTALFLAPLALIFAAFFCLRHSTAARRAAIGALGAIMLTQWMQSRLLRHSGLPWSFVARSSVALLQQLLLPLGLIVLLTQRRVRALFRSANP